jgi:hypothetical protein
MGFIALANSFWSFVIGAAISMGASYLFRKKLKNASPTYGEQMSTIVSSSAVIPLIYGEVKTAGNLIYSRLSNDKKIVYKLISFEEGEVQEIYGVTANDLLINAEPAIKISNRLYPSASVSVTKTGSKDETTVTISLNTPASISTITLNKSYVIFNGEVYSEYSISAISRLLHSYPLYVLGWIVKDVISCSNPPKDFVTMSATPCYNTFVGIQIDKGYKDTEINLNKYLGDGVQLIDSRVLGDTQEDKAKTVGGLRNDVYVALDAKASNELSGDFNLTAIIKGKKIKVYSSKYAWTVQWSNNPIWIILDFLTSPNGVGIKNIEEQIDIDSFIEAAAYCDELVTYSTGYTEKRFTLNLILDEKKSRLDWLLDMMMSCRAYPVFQNGKLAVMIEKPQDVVQVFDADDISNVELWWLPMEEIADVVHLTYIDPEYDWTKVIASATATKPLRDFPNIAEQDILGVTSFHQASCLSWFYLNQSTTATQFIKFSTNKRALCRSIGDVIEVIEPVMEMKEAGRSGKRYRIVSLAEAQDNKIEITAREYNENLFSNTLGSALPTVNLSNLPNPFRTPPEIQSVKSINQYYYVLNKAIVSYVDIEVVMPEYSFPFKLIIYKRKVGEQWEFVTYSNSSTFSVDVDANYTYEFLIKVENHRGITSNGFLVDPIYILGKNSPPKIVTNFKINQVVGGVTLTWDASNEPDVFVYNLYKGNSAEETDLIISNYSGTSYFYPLTAGYYIFHIRAVDTVGNLSAAITAEITINPPKQVEEFNVIQNGSTLDFYWKANSGEVVGYEIREGDNWEYGNVIGSTMGSYMKLTFAPPGYKTFWIKAKSTYGVYSEQASFTTLIINLPQNLNSIQKISAHSDWNAGSKFNMHINSNGLQLDNLAVYGEYTQLVTLPKMQTARNWADYLVVAVGGELPSWGDAGFNWDSDKAHSPWLDVTGDRNFNMYSRIAPYVGIDTGKYIESFPMNNSLTGDLGTLPVISAGAGDYQESRYGKGLFIDDTTYVKWDVDIPSIFSTSFTIKVVGGIPSDAIYMTLKGAGNSLHVGYDSTNKVFYLVDELRNRIELPLEFSNNDYITIAISQGASVRRIIGRSLSVNKKIMTEDNLTPNGSFTSLSMYGTI